MAKACGRLGLPPHERRAPGAGVSCIRQRGRDAVQRVAQPFRRLAQLARFAQWTEAQPIGPDAARRAGAGRSRAPRAAALLELAPAAAWATIVAASSGAWRRSAAADHQPSGWVSNTYPAALPRGADDLIKCALRRNHAMPSRPPAKSAQVEGSGTAAAGTPIRL